MSNPRKPATNMSKLPSAGARPKATPSTKENIQPFSSRATRLMLSSKLPKTHASSNGAKDSELDGANAESDALVASLRAEIDRLKKVQAAKVMENKLEEIPRPTRITSLQAAMGLTKDKKLYIFCRSIVRDVIARAGLPIDVDWRNQDAVAIGKIAQLASTRAKQLQRYKGNWATIEIMKTLVKNRCSYRARNTSLEESDGRNTAKDINGEGEGKKEDVKEDVNDEDDDWENMYATYKNQMDNDKEDENADEDEDEVGEGGNGGEGSDGSENGGDEGEFGDEGRNGEAHYSKRRSVQWVGIKRKASQDDEPSGNRSVRVGTKRKVIQDDEPVTTRAKKQKMDGSRGHQAATQSTEKAPPKRKNTKK